jgi:hypothetical protein
MFLPNICGAPGAIATIAYVKFAWRRSVGGKKNASPGNLEQQDPGGGPRPVLRGRRRVPLVPLGCDKRADPAHQFGNALVQQLHCGVVPLNRRLV